MTLLKKMLIATSMVLFASVVSAETFPLGDVTGDSVFGVSNDVTGTFSDEATFTLSSASGFDAALFNLSFSTYSAITDFTLTITSGASTILTLMPTSVVETASFTLAAGNYLISITGNTGAVGTYDFTVSPVPEASTIALFMSGLGFIGYAVRRRRKL